MLIVYHICADGDDGDSVYIVHLNPEALTEACAMISEYKPITGFLFTHLVQS